MYNKATGHLSGLTYWAKLTDRRFRFRAVHIVVSMVLPPSMTLYVVVTVPLMVSEALIVWVLMPAVFE